jgi:hypothetical protein
MYFIDAQYVHSWQYDTHLCDCPSRSTRVSAFTERHICLLLSPNGKSGQLCAQAFPLFICIYNIYMKNFDSFPLYQRKNYHDPLRSLFVDNF